MGPAGSVGEPVERNQQQGNLERIFLGDLGYFLRTKATAMSAALSMGDTGRAPQHPHSCCETTQTKCSQISALLTHGKGQAEHRVFQRRPFWSPTPFFLPGCCRLLLPSLPIPGGRRAQSTLAEPSWCLWLPRVGSRGCQGQHQWEILN